MDIIKKTAIIGGAVVGGLIGGAVSIAGHLAKNKFVDELGGNIVDSAILTGSIAGQIANGAHFIPKPFSIDQLNRKVNEVLSNSVTM